MCWKFYYFSGLYLNSEVSVLFLHRGNTFSFWDACIKGFDVYRNFCNRNILFLIYGGILLKTCWSGGIQVTVCWNCGNLLKLPVWSNSSFDEFQVICRILVFSGQIFQTNNIPLENIVRTKRSGGFPNWP